MNSVLLQEHKMLENLRGDEEVRRFGEIKISIMFTIKNPMMKGLYLVIDEGNIKEQSKGGITIKLK